ncbi:FliO/MopB family protein [Parasporobacterium paucivorans]|uniref:Flagellar biosynthesis protein, FliO n=1 Tax=Parasporobacterium paucivorans DSM 15970 TaxID=1122934 RepID=A0A1M6I9G4_9FIRM|nr:flagellar biosynthetic protein FliO [Parasporobacterium paucivorans]SHJ31013.1 Flagellar biosynthesis protein, FliO [Parasporobacterium paucivorans DSM 15970]
MIESIGTAVFTLAVVAAVIYLSYVSTKYIAKKNIGMQRTSSRYMKVIDQMGMGKDKSVALIQTGLNYYLVGFSGSGITLLAQLEEEDLAELPREESFGMNVPTDFKGILEKIDQFKNRRK